MKECMMIISVYAPNTPNNIRIKNIFTSKYSSPGVRRGMSSSIFITIWVLCHKLFSMKENIFLLTSVIVANN